MRVVCQPVKKPFVCYSVWRLRINWVLQRRLLDSANFWCLIKSEERPSLFLSLLFFQLFFSQVAFFIFRLFVVNCLSSIVFSTSSHALTKLYSFLQCGFTFFKSRNIRLCVSLLVSLVSQRTFLPTRPSFSINLKPHFSCLSYIYFQNLYNSILC